MTELPILRPAQVKHAIMFVINQHHMTGTSTLLESLDELQSLRSGREPLKYVLGELNARRGGRPI
jgi:hypothetical protein